MRQWKVVRSTRRSATALAVAVVVGVVSGVVAAPAATTREGGGVPGEPARPAAAEERPQTQDRRSQKAGDAEFDKVSGRGSVQVLVGLQTAFTPEPALKQDEARKQRDEHERATAEVLETLKGTDHAVVHTFETVPYVALKLSRGALERLRRSGKAASVQEDTADAPQLGDSISIVEADEAHVLGRRGSGQTVAVLDTGVDRSHSFLQQFTGGPSKVVSEACFSARSNCPGGVSSSTASGSGVPCSYAASGCQHGTHVAGIAAGRSSSINGVAPSARLVSVQVFSRFTGSDCAGAGEDPCTLSFTSDQIKGLERVFALRSTFPIAAVNMSLGSASTTSSSCDTDSRKPAIDNLRAAGIATVIASGNSGSNTGVSAPACISTAVTVGATTKTDVVRTSSNSSPQVELLAPGAGINSSVPGGAFGMKSGTSMAAPHVAGAWAVMKSLSPLSVTLVLSHLQATGRQITDADNGVTRPRIRVLPATVRIRDTGLQLQTVLSTTGADVASNGVGLATRAGGPASGNITIGGIPAGSSILSVQLLWNTLGERDPSVVFDGVSRTGSLIGASADTCWGLGINRVYRAVLPTSAVPGNSSHMIAGVGNAGGGTGASLVVLFRDPSSTLRGTVHVRAGALSLRSASTTISDTFFGLSVPANPTRLKLHTGFGDGQSGAEGALIFNGTAVTPSSFMSGKDGRMWDDDRILMPTGLLPAGSTTRTTSISSPASSGDCLLWAHQTLAYQHP